ncbi:recombinase family protein [Azospirillum sp. TSO35-2]|uniref:recombinase family protein n=1 Tax=Azospirillum sp. TSO35-2 TaxID=716796 RepID=UPI000D64F7F8|nr:recombinase family protein [Azospirillum sp. TSO35-2]
MRAAIYARFSSDNQLERSIDDQLLLCRDFVERNGGTVVAIYADYALSGAHLRTRPQALRLLGDAKAGSFDTVVAEGLDRLSRDQEDTAAIYKRLGFAGIRLVTVQEGEISELHVGLKGTMNALFLRDLATKVRRAQSGRAKDGIVPTGLSYGYDLVREFDRDGNPVRGRRRVNPEQAAIIRRIYREFAAGISPRAIADGLNRDHIPSPAGGHWNASTINGNPARKNGILYNEAYIGFLIYNRLHMVKDPETGKRVPRLNPHSDWVVTEVPELRIIDDVLWEQVQAIKNGFKHLRVNKCRRPKHLFSGLLRCGCCGGAYTVKSKDQLACSTYRESGASVCANNRTIRLRDLQERVLDGVRTQLLSPKLLALYVKTYGEERRRLRAEAGQKRNEVAAQVSKLGRQIDNIVDAIAEGTAGPALRGRLANLELQKAEADAAMAAIVEAEAATDAVVELHPQAAQRYREQLEALDDALAGGDESRQEAASTLRALLARIEIHPGERRGETHLTVHGRIEELLSLTRKRPGEGSGTVARTAMMVAAEGFEPPTKGL